VSRRLRVSVLNTTSKKPRPDVSANTRNPLKFLSNTLHSRLRQRLAEAKLPGTRIVCLSVMVYL
jgi:hypothetical protein